MPAPRKAEKFSDIDPVWPALVFAILGLIVAGAIFITHDDSDGSVRAIEIRRVEDHYGIRELHIVTEGVPADPDSSAALASYVWHGHQCLAPVIAIPKGSILDVTDPLVIDFEHQECQTDP